MTFHEDLHDLLDERFRANPSFELLEHDRLPEDKRTLFSGLARDGDYYGLLIPRQDSSLGVLAVDHDTAQLFRTLAHPAQLPDLARPSPDLNRRVAQLVLDGVLELGQPGRYVSGPAAHAFVFKTPFAEPHSEHPVTSLSYKALRLAQTLPTQDPAQVAAWLYKFHTLPLSPVWSRAYGTPERIEDALGLRDLPTSFGESYLQSEHPGWRAWNLQDALSERETPFKLYLSPHPSVLGEAFRTAAQHLVDHRVPAFKLGKDAYGLLRPDKFMLYFYDLPSLNKVAEVLEEALSGCRAQGVPFSAAVDDTGLLSWGVDPPRSQRLPGWRGGESWRSWIVNSLARGLLRARDQQDSPAEAWLCALDRLRLEGININTWLPKEAVGS